MAKAGPSTSQSRPAILSTLSAVRSTDAGSSLPAKPRANGDFKTQDDFIPFADLLDDDGGEVNGKGKGRASREDPAAGAANGSRQRGRKRPIADVLEEQGKTRLSDVEKTTWAAHSVR